MKKILAFGLTPAAHVVIQDLFPYCRHLWAESAEEAAQFCREHQPDLAVIQTDSLEPVTPLLASLCRGYAAVPVIVIAPPKPLSYAVELSQLGALYYLPLPLCHDELKQTAAQIVRKPSAEHQPGFTGTSLQFIGSSCAAEDIRMLITSFARTEEPVLITGETGTGKEIAARMIHDLSRRQGPFSPINCSALPLHLAESELFGHKRGSFTGAGKDHIGRLAASSGGTLFLDEVGDLDVTLQPKLLRAIEQQEVYPVGSTSPVPVCTRIISATNDTLLQRVNEGGFRADLFYRINILHIHIPPLRERIEDIPLLAQHILQDFHQVTIRDSAVDALQAYHWPGNVRELINTLKRAVIVFGNSGGTTCLSAYHINAVLQHMCLQHSREYRHGQYSC